jgi:hypothetical protein
MRKEGGWRKVEGGGSKERVYWWASLGTMAFKVAVSYVRGRKGGRKEGGRRREEGGGRKERVYQWASLPEGHVALWLSRMLCRMWEREKEERKGREKEEREEREEREGGETEERRRRDGGETEEREEREEEGT